MLFFFSYYSVTFIPSWLSLEQSRCGVLYTYLYPITLLPVGQQWPQYCAVGYCGVDIISYQGGDRGWWGGEEGRGEDFHLQALVTKQAPELVWIMFSDQCWEVLGFCCRHTLQRAQWDCTSVNLRTIGSVTSSFGSREVHLVVQVQLPEMHSPLIIGAHFADLILQLWLSSDFDCMSCVLCIHDCMSCVLFIHDCMSHICIHDCVYCVFHTLKFSHFLQA